MKKTKTELDMSLLDEMKEAVRKEKEAEEKLKQARLVYEEAEKEQKECARISEDAYYRTLKALRRSGIRSGRARVIASGVASGLTNRKLEVLASDRYSVEQAEKMCTAFTCTCGKIPFDTVVKFADKGYSADRLDVVYSGLYMGLSEEFVEKCADGPFVNEQLEQLFDVHCTWVSCFELSFSSLYNCVMPKIQRTSPDFRLTEEQLDSIADPRFSENLICVLKMAYAAGIPKEVIGEYAKPDMPYQEAHDAFVGYLNAKNKKKATA